MLGRLESVRQQLQPSIHVLMIPITHPQPNPPYFTSPILLSLLLLLTITTAYLFLLFFSPPPPPPPPKEPCLDVKERGGRQKQSASVVHVGVVLAEEVRRSPRLSARRQGASQHVHSFAPLFI